MTNVEALTEVLGKEADAYERLFEKAEGKRQIIIDRDLSALEKSTEAEQDLSDELKGLEGKRIEILKTFTDGDEVPTVTNIIDALPEGDSSRAALQQAKEKVLEVAGRMQFLNQQNEILLRQAMEMVEFDLTLFKSLRQAPESGNYGKDAYNTGELLGSGGFDA